MDQKERKEHSPEERIQDIEKLIEMRDYKIRRDTLKKIITMYCYWTMQKEGNQEAVRKSMALNDQTKEPLDFATIENALGYAMEKCFDSMDEEKNRIAKENGYPRAGLNYTAKRLSMLFEITKEEKEHLTTI